ncbi:MAG: hypothetical protein IKU86_08350 [Thermoguttaceae bacterium]|nr:hypothetical protein [Thermoguttaceae bacterium]
MNESYYLIEHAVFEVNWTRRSTSGRNETTLLKATDGASRVDLDEALDWASRVEIFDVGYDPRNLFFFPTPSGSFVVGRLTPAPREAEKGAFYFQTFFVEEDAFFQCGANPIALLHFALNTTRFSLYRPGAALEPFRLEARAPWIDRAELRRTTDRLGARALATLLQSALDSIRSTFVSHYNAFLVVAALFELTPIDWRPELTFAVGVRFREDFSLRLVGATARRGVEPSCGEFGIPCVDLRDVVENDDAYPIENAWAALVELALKRDRVDYLYGRTAEEFWLRRKDRDEDGVERTPSSDEIAELGLRWRLDLENELRDEENALETEDRDVDETSDAVSWSDEDERDEESESFFNGEFEGGWKDSDGDEAWRIDAPCAADAPANERSEKNDVPEFVFRIVEPSESEREPTPRDRENNRETDAAQNKNDNKNDRVAPKRERNFASDDDVFSGVSFEDEWKERLQIEGNKPNQNGESGSTSDDWLRVFGEKDGFSSADGGKRKPIVGKLDDVLEWLERNPANDKSRGLDALTDLKAFVGVAGAEALERLKRAEGRSGRSADDEPSERDVRRWRLSPFAALSAEFPKLDKELRRFDALFDAACDGSEAAIAAALDFWRRWRRSLDEATGARIRRVYEEQLLGRWAAVEGGAIEQTERLATALAVYSAIFLER